MINEIQQDAEQRMQRSIAALSNELTRMRTGRAHPSLLEHITVDYYGQATPIKQVANVSVEDARTLAVTPWEKTLVPAVEKAILSADLGLNPVTAGTTIRVPLPALTEERRKEFVKLVRQEAENARVAVRNIRRDANADIKQLLKEKAITEDDERRSQEQTQHLTDKYVREIDQLLAQKEKDLLAV